MIDFIYDTIKEFIVRGRQCEIDQFLFNISRVSLPVDVVIIILVATYEIRCELSNLYGFYKTQCRLIKSREDLERLTKIRVELNRRSGFQYD